MGFRCASCCCTGLLLTVVLVALALVAPASASTLHMGGTGGATGPLRLIGAGFTAKSAVPVEVIPGLGSSGGISAAMEGVLQVVVSGRTLAPAEAAGDLIPILTVCTPYVLATSHPSPVSLDRDSVAAIFSQTAPTWPDGVPIRIILRPKAESDNATLIALFPGMDRGLAQARTRDSVPIGATDQDNADLAEHIPGSLIGSTYAQILTEHRALQFVAINGMLPDIDAMKSGRYPYAKRLYFIAARHAAREVLDFQEFLGSPAGVQAMRDSGLVACPD
jgi:phosphate transport system substrate-binding protein